MSIRLRSPLTIAIAIVVAGAAGGTAVYLTGSRIGDQDRAAILAWESDVAALLAEPHDRFLELPSLADRAAERGLRAALIDVRRTFQDAREALPSVTTPRILYQPTISLIEVCCWRTGKKMRGEKDK